LLASGLLREEQADAASFLLTHERAALWMMPGLGKTLATLAALEQLTRTAEVERTLVITTKRVARLVWPQELEKWGLDWEQTQLAGIPAARRKKELRTFVQGSGIAFINFELIPWMLQEMPDLFSRLDCVVIDESSKLKAWNTKRFKALRKVAFQVPWFWELTGTPAPNGLLGVWSQMFLLDKGERLGTGITHYKSRYFESDYMGFNWKPKDPARIYDRVKGLVFSLRNTQYRDLVNQVQIPTETTKHYQEMKKDGLLTGPDDWECVAEGAASQINKLRQLSNGFAYGENEEGEREPVYFHAHKLEALGDLIEELGGEPLLVFYEFQADRNRILQKFGKQVTLFDEKHLDAWNRGEIPVLLMSPWSAGHGLNMQGSGNTICWFNPPYDLEIHEQANARLARTGQQADSVAAYYLCGEGTLDGKVLELLEEKDMTQDRLMRALEEEL
jgi:hypothetical protein